LVERFGNEPRVRLYRNQTNLGMAFNFERALELARGEFVLWLSSDDWLFPTHIAELEERFATNAGLDLVYGNAYFALEDGTVFGKRELPGQFPVDYVDVRDELVENFTTICPISFPCVLFRRSVLDEPGIWRRAEQTTELAGDWELMIRLALAGKRFAYVARPTMAIRVHAEQSTGEDYHRSGQSVVEFAVFVERYIDHPEFVARMRGHEIGIAVFLAAMVHGVSERNGGLSPLSGEEEARINALQKRLASRAAAYEPARVRDARITVVLEAAAAPALVMRSLDALAEQTFERWDLAVVDHGPIPVESLLRAHPAWPRTSYVRHDAPLTPGAARNLALRMVRGEYVAFLEPGDRYAPDHLATAVDTIARAGAQASLSAFRLVLELTNETASTRTPLGEIAPFGTADAAEIAWLTVAQSMPLDALVVYRGVFDRLGTFDQTLPLWDDWEFLLRLARTTPLAATGVATLDQVIRIGLTASRLKEKLPQALGALDAIYAKHPVDERLAAERRAHRAELVAAFGAIAERTVTARGLAEVAAVLAGRAISFAGAR
jgi:glycosyltransferase involved in cell wall biosynthesis